MSKHVADALRASHLNVVMERKALELRFFLKTRLAYHSLYSDSEVCMCKNSECPIYGECDKELEQSFYCRKIELLLHLSKLTKTKPRSSYIHLKLPKVIN